MVFSRSQLADAAQREAAQEHLNRALIVEHEAVPGAEIVNVLPQPKAGSSFATAAYQSFRHPVALEEIRADAGLDIGGTLIGMHLKKVAVPVRLPQNHIGSAILLAAAFLASVNLLQLATDEHVLLLTLHQRQQAQSSGWNNSMPSPCLLCWIFSRQRRIFASKVHWVLLTVL